VVSAAPTSAVSHSFGVPLQRTTRSYYRVMQLFREREREKPKDRERERERERERFLAFIFSRYNDCFGSHATVRHDNVVFNNAIVSALHLRAKQQVQRERHRTDTAGAFPSVRILHRGIQVIFRRRGALAVSRISTCTITKSRAYRPA